MTVLRLSLVIFLVVAARADAEVLCGYNPSSRAMSVVWTASGDGARIFRRDENLIVDAGGQEIGCMTQPTVANTDSITVSDFAGTGSNNATFDLAGGPFGTIKLAVHMGQGFDTVAVQGTAGADNFRLGDHDAKVNGTDLTYDGLSPDNDSLVIAGREGNDTVRFEGTLPGIVGGDAGDDTLIGGNGFDILQDGAGNDHVDGGPGNDFLAPDPGGADSWAGGLGTDTLAFEEGNTRVDLRLTGPQDTDVSGVDSFSTIENISTDDGDDVLIGDDESNLLTTDVGADVVVGDGGILDMLDGGSGVDTLSYASAPRAVTVDLALARQHTGGGGEDMISGFENLTGSAFADVLAGTDGPNTLTGLGGEDSIFARGGNDLIEVRDGLADAATCGAGDDVATADITGVDVLADCEVVRSDVRPDTAVVSGPPSLTRDATPTFAFRATKPGGFECSLDGTAYAACASPQTLQVGDGAHVFRIRAVDTLGNRDDSPVLRTFTVDATRPRITRARLTGTTLRYRMSEDAVVTIKARRRILHRRAHKGRNRITLRASKAVLIARDRAGNRSRRVTARF